MQALNDLIELLKDKDTLLGQALTYRVYGLVALEKYEQAVKDLKLIKKTGQIDLESVYNQNLSKGILKMDHEDYLMASKYFEKAWKLFPSNKDCYLLQVISVVHSYTYSLYNYYVDHQIKYDKVKETKQFLDKAIANCGNQPSLLFFRGLLHYQLYQFKDAVDDFTMSISDDEEPTPEYYLARGRAFACMLLIDEAIQDLNKALELDPELQQAYLFRGRCAFLAGDNNQAFKDFQKMILNDPKNPHVHVHAGKLLMTTGAYDDAIKAFQNADSLEVVADSLY